MVADVETVLRMRKELQQETYSKSFHKNEGNRNDGSSECTLEDEKRANKILQRLLLENEVIKPHRYFLENVDEYEESPIFQFLRNMPKGAHLHTHGIATGDFKKLSAYILKQENLYVWIGSKTDLYIYGVFKYLRPTDIPEEEKQFWKLCSEFSLESIYELITMSKDTTSNGKCTPRPWADFQILWLRIRLLTHAVQTWSGKNSFFWTILEDQYRAGITYIEFREILSAEFSNPYDRVDADIFLQAFADTVELFKKEHPDFLGAKLIFCSLKIETEEQVKEDVLLAIELKELFPDYMAGFDLVGEEDLLRPLKDYTEQLIMCKAHGIPLFLHAGETLQTATATQMYDAVALGTSRMGHGYDLINHPSLLKKVLKDNITVECCPISNQVLGYSANLMNHYGKTMFRHGVRMTISSDDAGMFHYHDPTYDWTAITVAWGLDLFQIKHLARQSFECATTLGPDLVRVAEENFDAAWGSFIRKTLAKYAQDISTQQDSLL